MITWKHYIVSSTSGMFFCRVCGSAYSMGNCGCDCLRPATVREGYAWLEAGVTVEDMIRAREILDEWGTVDASDDAIVIANSMRLALNQTP